MSNTRKISTRLNRASHYMTVAKPWYLFHFPQQMFFPPPDGIPGLHLLHSWTQLDKNSKIFLFLYIPMFTPFIKGSCGSPSIAEETFCSIWWGTLLLVMLLKVGAGPELNSLYQCNFKQSSKTVAWSHISVLSAQFSTRLRLTNRNYALGLTSPG